MLRSSKNTKSCYPLTYPTSHIQQHRLFGIFLKCDPGLRFTKFAPSPAADIAFDVISLSFFKARGCSLLNVTIGLNKHNNCHFQEDRILNLPLCCVLLSDIMWNYHFSIEGLV